jgi:SAM-dependent methyltransferase
MTAPTVGGDAFKAFEAARWEATAAGYDDFFGHIAPRVVERLLDAAAVGPGQRVLDAACGPGYAAARAADRDACVVGLDVAEAMVTRARARYPRVAFCRGDVEALPFPSGSFDAVIASFALHHLGDPQRAVAEFARVLVAGGRLALTVWDRPGAHRLVGVLLDAITSAQVTAPPDVPAGPDFFQFSGDDELRSLLHGHGLGDIEVSTLSFAHRVSSSDELWQGLLNGTVRMSSVVSAQPDDVRHRIQAAFESLLETHRAGAVLDVPVSVKLARAQCLRSPPALDEPR